MSTKGKKTGRKRRQKKLWKSLFDVRNDFTYNKMIGILEQKGIDYRIWMDADDEDLIYLRETFGGPERGRAEGPEQGPREIWNRESR